MGSHVVSSSGKTRGKTQSGKSSASSSATRTYVDNAYNRKLGRVGKPLGFHPISSSGGRLYVDNAHNRRLGRALKPMPPRICKQQEIMEKYTLEDIFQKLQIFDRDNAEFQRAHDIMEIEEVERGWSSRGISIPIGANIIVDAAPEKIAYNDLKVEKEIGHGGFGVVYACLWDNKPVAYKKLRNQSMSKKSCDLFVEEIKILVSLDHPNIVKLFGAVIEEGKMGFVMEYMKCTLFRALFIDETEYREDEKKRIVSKLANALQYLHMHEPKIAHCDIKSGNVLLDVESNPKLCDFGLSTVKNTAETSQSRTVCPALGTPRYSAPEVLRGDMLTVTQLFKADIYSLTIVVFEVVAQEEPFEGLSVRQLEAQVGRGNLRPTSDVVFSEQVSSFLTSCWDASAANRPTATQFLEKWDKITDLYK